MPLALVFLFILLMLEVGLVQLQVYANENTLKEEKRLAFQIGTEAVHTHLGTAIETGETSGPVNFSKEALSYDIPKSDLVIKAKWDGKTSIHRPFPTDWSDFDKIFRKGSSVPEFSFDSVPENLSEGPPLPIGHTRLELDAGSHNFKSTAVFSHTFPYGIYTPQGDISAFSVSDFSNPVAYKKDDSTSETSGRPVDIRARGDISVTDYYSSGRAISESGLVQLPVGPDSPGAFGLSGQPSLPKTWNSRLTNLHSVGSRMASGALDKTTVFDDQLFTIGRLKEIFSGKIDSLLSIFSVGQACKVPFFPIPAVQAAPPFLWVIYIHHPYPVDFTGTPQNPADSKKLEGIAKNLSEKKAELEKNRSALNKEEAKDRPSRREINRLKAKIADLESDIKSLSKSADEIIERKKKRENLPSRIGKIPETAGEDSSQKTKGWSYFYIAGNLLETVLKLVRGKNPFDNLFIPTRLIHLGNNDPDWDWSSGRIDIKANLTVPPGRTLKLTKSEIVVEGDIFLQRGALLAITGNLTVERPSIWPDFKGLESSDFGGSPKGRVILQEGASLVVSGDLNVNGGDFHKGSVLVASSYGPNLAMTRLVQAGGDIRILHGVSPAVTIGDLVDELAKENSQLKGFNEHFFIPLVEDVFPVIGKLPHVGAWQPRASWFAEYATTIEYIFVPPVPPLFPGAQVVSPIPLPYENGLRKVFKYFSIMYSAELNAFIGENLYTHSTYWFFGRGASPILLKIYPNLIKDEFLSLRWTKIVATSLTSQAATFLKDDMPDLALKIVRKAIAKIVVEMVKSVLPFVPPSSGGDPDDPSIYIKKIATEFLQETLKDFDKLLRSSYERALRRMKNEIYDKLNQGNPEYSLKRQLPGIVVTSTGRIEVGDGSMLATGLFLAKGDIDIRSEEVIGTVISTEGNVFVKDFLHYPYFDRLSVYEPKQRVSLWENVATVTAPKGSVAGTLNDTWTRRIGVGIR